MDVLHLHWPEWLTGLDLARNEQVVSTLADIGVPVLWTQHNLSPHATPDEIALYQPWADLAAGVIHHSRWGQTAITARYRFRPDARHAVIPHGHWGPLMHGFEQIDRAAAEAELGLEPCALRIGLVGAPRPGKDTQLLLDGVAASTRSDVQLLVLSLAGENVPDDPRITALTYEEVPRDEYDRRLATIDVLASAARGRHVPDDRAGGRRGRRGHPGAHVILAVLGRGARRRRHPLRPHRHRPGRHRRRAR